MTDEPPEITALREYARTVGRGAAKGLNGMIPFLGTLDRRQDRRMDRQDGAGVPRLADGTRRSMGHRRKIGGVDGGDNPLASKRGLAVFWRLSARD